MLKVEDKFEKLLLSFTGALFVIMVVLFMKGEDDALKKENFKKDLKDEFLDEELITKQAEIEKDKSKLMSEIVNSPQKELIEEVVDTTTTLPPPPVKEVVEKKPDKKTKSS